VFNVGSVQGYLKLNTTGWSASMRSANMSVGTLTRSFSRMGIVAVGSLMLIEREFGRFDKAIRHATSVSETTNEQFMKMSEMALDASVNWNKTATQTAQAFYFLGSAGLTVTEQMEAFNTTIMLSRAMGSELSQTVEGTVDVVRAFSLEFANIDKIADQLTKTVISSNQQFRTLTQALSYASSTAALTNNTLAETNAMLGVMANAGIKGCYDDKTDVLTARGWIPWGQVSAEDSLATENPETGALEYQKPTQLIRYHHKGKMYHVANRGIDLCVTPKHRMWVKRRGQDKYGIVTASNVNGKDVRYKAGGLHWGGTDAEHHTLAGFQQNRGSWVKSIPDMSINTEVWATFLGWYISEGSCDYREGNYRIRITQNPGEVRDRMRDVLSKLPVPVGEDKNGFSICNEQVWKAVKPLGKAPEKYIPEYALNWSPKLLGTLLIALMEGDGDCNECYYTSSKRLADNVMELALKLGVSATAVIKSKAGTISNYDKEGRAIKSQYDQWKVSVKREQLEPAYYPAEYKGVHGDRLDGSKFPHCSEWVDYDGEVFCAEVPNHLLIVRRNGKPIVSGNSMAGTVLRRAMTNLMAPTGDMADLIFELGLNIYDSSGAMRPFINIMGELSDKLSGASEQYKNLTFETLFGRRAIAGQIQLFNYGAVALRNYADEIENASGTAERVAGKQMKAFTEVLGQLWREMQRIAIIVGDTLAPAIERMAVMIRERLGVFRDYVKVNSEAVGETLKWTAAIATLAVIGPPVVFVLMNLVTQFGMLAKAMVTVAGAAMTNPFTLLLVSLYILRATLMKEGFWDDVWSGYNTALDFVVERAKSQFKTLQWYVYKLQMRTLEIAAAKKSGDSERIKANIMPWDEDRTKAEMIRFTKAYDHVAESFTDNLKVIGKTAIDIMPDITKAVGDALAKDVPNIMSKFVDSLTGINPALDALLTKFGSVFGEIKNIAATFMTEPSKFGGFAMAIPGVDAADQERRMLGVRAGMSDWRDMMKEIEEPTKWETLWRNALTGVIFESVKWSDLLVTAFNGIRSAWASTFEDVLNNGGKMNDFLEKMFTDILRQLNHLASVWAANKLFAGLFGSGMEGQPGSVINRKRSFNPFARLINPNMGGSYTPPSTGSQLGISSDNYSINKPQPLGPGEILHKRISTPQVEINVMNTSGTPMNLVVKGQKMTARKMIVDAVMTELNENPNFAAAVKG